MTLPTIFANENGNQPASQLDTNFKAVAAMAVTACTASGTNTLTLTPVANQPDLFAYADNLHFGFVAAATSTDAVNAQVNALASLPLYTAAGAPAGAMAVIQGLYYEMTYFSSLDAGSGGFLLTAGRELAGGQSPQGRLTITPGDPVMHADSFQDTIFYDPYIGNLAPVSTGNAVAMYAFSQLSMKLIAANHLAGKIYDLFLFIDSGGAVQIGSGPAWATSVSRGSGSGTTAITLIDGLWTNVNLITLKNDVTSYSGIPAGQATYIGSFYCNADAQTGMAFKPAAAAGGSANILGLYNAYNRVLTASIESDSTASWTDASGAWRNADNSAGNRITFLDGLQQSFLDAAVQVFCTTSAATVNAKIGIALDGVTPPVQLAQSGSATVSSLAVRETFTPQLGLHYLQHVEISLGTSATSTFSGNGLQSLSLRIEL